MFKPKTQKIENLAELLPTRINELEKIFERKTNIYIDYANVRPWAQKLGWHVDLRRLKQLLDSFDTINKVKIYAGTLQGDFASEKLVDDLKKAGYEVVTKPVKIMKLSIDISGIPIDSPDVIKNFVNRSLLKQLKLENITQLNDWLLLLNNQGIKYIEDRKCNFDVEMGVDILLDNRSGEAENFVLWTGDSDFANPVQNLLEEGKEVFIFASARLVSKELSVSGAKIFDVRKLRSIICWPKEIV